jgi:hypothetical protein
MPSMSTNARRWRGTEDGSSVAVRHMRFARGYPMIHFRRCNLARSIPRCWLFPLLHCSANCSQQKPGLSKRLTASAFKSLQQETRTQVLSPAGLALPPLPILAPHAPFEIPVPQSRSRWCASRSTMVSGFSRV